MQVSLRLSNRPTTLQPPPPKLNPIPFGGENQKLSLFRLDIVQKTLPQGGFFGTLFAHSRFYQRKFYKKCWPKIVNLKKFSTQNLFLKQNFFFLTQYCFRPNSLYFSLGLDKILPKLNTLDLSLVPILMSLRSAMIWYDRILQRHSLKCRK